MPSDLVMLCPMDESDALELSRTLWRKQLLPLGTINYKGRKIKFDRQYLEDLVKSFKDGAFDQVPFMLAKDDNSHTMDPERFRGEVKGVEMTADGVDVLLELTDDAADLIRENPKLGVSARIIEGLERADGKKFSRAVQHVLGTLDPRVTGMKSWKQVSLSEEPTDTLDLTEDFTWDDSEALLMVPEEEEFEFTEPVLDPKEARIQELETELARERYIRELRGWVDKGVPPAIVQLARPVLEQPECVIDLSNGSSLDVAKVVRGMLEETTGFIQLAMERGNNFDENDLDGDPERGRAEQLLQQWAKTTK